MALNLWKLGGQPTAYNPLPLGLRSVTLVPQNTDYLVKIKAKSATSGKLAVWVSTESSDTGMLSLTPVLKEYIVPKTTKTSNGSLFIWDYLSNGDIIIDSIQLVQKPLPKLTINGIDGFSSGKWALHANAKVIDDETMELNVTSPSQRSGIAINVIPNQVYTFSHNSDLISGVYFIIRDTNAAGALLYNTSMVKSVTVTAPSSGIMWISTQNDLATGNFTFKRPMLNLGAPAPYSKKTGDKMVLPVAKKNLFNLNHPKTTNVNVYEYRIQGKPSTDYTLSTNSPYSTLDSPSANVYFGGLSTGVNGVKEGSPKTLKTGSDGIIFVAVRFSLENAYDKFVSGQYWLQLEEGTTSTAYTPYAVQLNTKPKRYVTKKNLFDGQLELGDIDTITGANIVNASRTRTINFIPVVPNRVYVQSSTKGQLMESVFFYDVNKNFISMVTNIISTPTITVPSNAMYAKARGLYSDVANQWQLEEGTTQTAYEPYTPIIPRAKTGSAFNGTTDYLQLPSMTMDSVEIDCLIDSSNGSAGSTILFDARTNVANGYAYSDGNIVGTPNLSMIGYAKGTRTKIKITSNTAFTDDVTIFANNAGGGKTKGILYKVTCYLNGAIVAQYDFENPNNIVGDKIIPSVKNLIPSFEDARWSLHANAKVLGKDVLRLDAPDVTTRDSIIIVDVLPNTSYKFLVTSNTTSQWVSQLDINGNSISGSSVLNSSTIVTSGTTRKLKIFLGNVSSGAGLFDFIKQQLYALDGKEGTIVGNPTKLRKASKRTLYAKR